MLVRSDVQKLVYELIWDAALNQDGLGREGRMFWQRWLSSAEHIKET